jgi:hypothetical protein
LTPKVLAGDWNKPASKRSGELDAKRVEHGHLPSLAHDLKGGAVHAGAADNAI